MDSSISHKLRLTQLYHHYRDELIQYLFKKFGHNTPESEDILHCAFEKISAHETDNKAVGHVKNSRAYLYRTVHNIAIDKHRSHERAEQYKADIVHHDDFKDSHSPERIIEGKQQLHLITQALLAMPKKRRQYLIMSRFHQLSYAEIARRAGISETAVRKHITKALRDCKNAATSEVR